MSQDVGKLFLLLTLYSPSRTAYKDEYLQTQSLELSEPTANVYFLTVPGQVVHDGTCLIQHTKGLGKCVGIFGFYFS
jgi:hypothetical protein